MLGRDFDSDDAVGLRGCAASPAATMTPECGGRAAGIASRQAHAGAIAAGVLIAGALACAAPSAASARELRLRYDVTVLGGVSLGEIEMTAMLDRAGYRIAVSTRPSRAAQLVGAAEQSGRVEGRWGRSGPEPRLYSANGSWRGRTYVSELHYPRGVPTIRRQEPSNEDREAVPPELIRGTVDSLSGVAGMLKKAAETESCDGSTAIYDGRRRSVAVMTSSAMVQLSGQGSLNGRALNCGFTVRTIAGFRHEDDREVAMRPLKGSVLIALREGGAFPLPLRFEVETRWFGTVAVQLAGPPVAAE
ncbi:DUF3108 domain-containing protein [Bosea sp. (in: a-proteobacteria)]|uniref:DUF3108 domain-containing protein n=1 Tax=Bosea sp. (in: a-proteobacteria) TaxID=1871050 RepID=UPI001AC791F3|nr:DUF3108 domain-containing protein [Bosea sp. (in: a-proteobacteria)]MBN9438113.1 DUF3108 domain-containing protein [Bosea sp. (in: a-proteobacteria)]